MERVANASGVAALLAPQAELLLHRAIRIAEQHRFGLGMMAHRHPARHDKDVVLLPGEDLVADPAFARPLDRDINRAVSRAVGPGCITLWQELDERADRRH